nr:MAG TPA: hypothetical protein [Caudoviricetes sp.]
MTITSPTCSYTQTYFAFTSKLCASCIFPKALYKCIRCNGIIKNLLRLQNYII